MMGMNKKAGMCQRRKRCCLMSCNRVITILGLLTIYLFGFTQLHSVYATDKIVERIEKDSIPKLGEVSSESLFKRSIDLQSTDENENLIEKPKNLNESDERKARSIIDSQHSQLIARRRGSGQELHRHSDGETYSIKGYKCVPIPEQKELTRKQELTSSGTSSFMSTQTPSSKLLTLMSPNLKLEQMRMLPKSDAPRRKKGMSLLVIVIFPILGLDILAAR